MPACRKPTTAATPAGVAERTELERTVGQRAGAVAGRLALLQGPARRRHVGDVELGVGRPGRRKREFASGRGKQHDVALQRRLHLGHGRPDDVVGIDRAGELSREIVERLCRGRAAAGRRRLLAQPRRQAAGNQRRNEEDSRPKTSCGEAIVKV